MDNSIVGVIQNNLPANLEDLSRFVLVGREKLVAVRAEIRAIDKVGFAQEVREQKLHEAQDLGDAVLDAEVRIGELMAAVPKASGGDRRSEKFKNNTAVVFEKTKAEVIHDAGLTSKLVERFQQMAAHPKIVAKAKVEARENGNIVSRAAVIKKIKAQKKTEEIEQAKARIAAQERPGEVPLLHVGNGIGFIPDEKYDLLLTDPPYSTETDDIDAFVESWLYTALDGVKPTGFAYVFIGAYPTELRAYLNAVPPEHIRLEQVLIWSYKNTLGNNPKDRYKQNFQACLFYRGINAPALDCPLTNEQWAVQEVNAPDGRVGDRYHAWQKPLELVERFIRHSTKLGDVVFDPFVCTGTTLLAAQKLGRRAYGFEINAENAAIAERRGIKLCREPIQSDLQRSPASEQVSAA